MDGEKERDREKCLLRARKRSSERTAREFMRRTETVEREVSCLFFSGGWVR